MVNPIYIFIIALGSAFLLSVFDRRGRHISTSVFLLALLAMTVLAGSWIGILWEHKISVYTAGFEPPFSINLQLGKEEAFFLFLTNLVGLLGGLFLLKKFTERGVLGMILFLMMIVNPILSFLPIHIYLMKYNLEYYHSYQMIMQVITIQNQV